MERPVKFPNSGKPRQHTETQRVLIIYIHNNIQCFIARWIRPGGAVRIESRYLDI